MLSADKYPRGSYQGYWYQDASYAKPGPPRATLTVATPPYNIARGIRGPSAMGPYTRLNTFGIRWGAGVTEVGGPGGEGESLGP
jgi:hypothetical protein